MRETSGRPVYVQFVNGLGWDGGGLFVQKHTVPIFLINK